MAEWVGEDFSLVLANRTLIHQMKIFCPTPLILAFSKEVDKNTNTIMDVERRI